MTSRDRVELEPVSRLLLGHISPAGGEPLYQQITDAVKREISEGRLSPGDAMPSFRTLARDLMVSLITVKRAYEDLEREGILHLRQGLGTVVAANADVVCRQAKTDVARTTMMDAVREASEAGLSEVQIRRMFDRILHDWETTS